MLRGGSGRVKSVGQESQTTRSGSKNREPFPYRCDSGGFAVPELCGRMQNAAYPRCALNGLLQRVFFDARRTTTIDS